MTGFAVISTQEKSFEETIDQSHLTFFSFQLSAFRRILTPFETANTMPLLFVLRALKRDSFSLADRWRVLVAVNGSLAG